MLVHCGGGKGRAGTFAACCLAMWGSSPPLDLTAERPVLSAQEAVRVVRSLRPGSIETQEQEAFVQVGPLLQSFGDMEQIEGDSDMGWRCCTCQTLARRAPSAV